MNFANILKDLRESKGITQKELASYLKVSRSTIAGYETKNRQPDFERLIKLSDFFGVTLEYLLTGSTDTSITVTPSRRPSEKVLDHDVLIAYKKLSLDSKLDVQKYIKLLELKDRQNGAE